MKTKPKSRGGSVPVLPRDPGVVDLFTGMDEWTDRIAKRAYELFQQHGSSDGHALEDWLAAEREFLTPFFVDIKKADGEFIVEAEVPGLKAKDVHVQVDGSSLVIEGRSKSKGNGKAQQVYRIIQLPGPIRAKDANGHFKNGILKLRLPFPATSKKNKSG